MSEPEFTIDPITGEQVSPGVSTQSPPNPHEEIGRLKERLDAFEKAQTQTQRLHATPPAPSGPTIEEQLSSFDKKISALDNQIDDAVNKGQPVSKLLAEQRRLSGERLRLEIRTRDLDPALSTGIHTIEQLSAEITRGKMTHFDLVKDDFEEALSSLSPEQRMNPEMRQVAYNIAVGKNIDKILNVKTEEVLRKVSDDPGILPGSNSRSKRNTNPAIPKPSDILDRGALNSLKQIGKTPDEWYRGLGYKGWEDFWEKKGKTEFADRVSAD